MNRAPASVWKNPIHFLAFGLGSGVSPKAPGTAGTLAAIPFFLLLQPLSLIWYAVIVTLAFVVGIYLCGKTSSDLGVHDHGGIVWDEFVGYWVTMFAAPSGWEWIVIGFVYFRIFDIVKPWPIDWVDKQVSGGLGIMLDDILAGVMAALCLQATSFLFLLLLS